MEWENLRLWIGIHNCFVYCERVFMNSNRVRISDIAEELGLSTATVSNVIHGKTKKISEETVKRVQELLEKREYIPSMAGLLLAQNDSRIIGVVVNDHEKYEGRVLEDGYISSAVNSLSREIDRAGQFMMLKITADPQEIPRFASMWNMVGLIAMGFCRQDYMRIRGRMHIPFVIYDGYFPESDAASHTICNITVDNFDGGLQMGRYLSAMGHQKVLCIADNDICTDRERYQGLRQSFPEARLLQVPMQKEQRYRFYGEHLPEIMEHTAVFAASDYYAADLILFLQAKGYSVPEDISVTGFDDSALCRWTNPPLTTVSQDSGQRASLAMKLLKELQEGSSGRQVVLPVSLVERQSVKALL